MLKLDDIKYVTFRKSNIGGYRPEDVDKFIDEVIVSYEDLLKSNENLETKVNALKQEVNKCKRDEELIRCALINMQNISEASVREAKHKSEIILKDANAKAGNIIIDAERKVNDKRAEFAILQSKISAFRANLLNFYKEHLKLINALPSDSNKGNGLEKEAAYSDNTTNAMNCTVDNYQLDENNDIGFGFSMSQKIYNNPNGGSDLKFGENYSIEPDKKSPIGFFNKD